MPELDASSDLIIGSEDTEDAEGPSPWRREGGVSRRVPGSGETGHHHLDRPKQPRVPDAGQGIQPGFPRQPKGARQLLLCPCARNLGNRYMDPNTFVWRKLI